MPLKLNLVRNIHTLKPKVIQRSGGLQKILQITCEKFIEKVNKKLDVTKMICVRNLKEF
jgi:hypothetical protein